MARQMNSTSETSAIQLDKTTMLKLKKKRVTKWETYDEIINRLFVENDGK